MAYITVKSQKELDMIPLDTEDIIRIEFGTEFSPAIVRNRYKYSVRAYGSSSVVAYGSSSVEAYDRSSVVAYGRSSVRACDRSSVVACDRSSVEAYGSSSVRACDRSSVVAYGSSSVVAYGSSSVEACGNVQILDYLQGATIQISGNARIVYLPRNIEEFMNYYRIEHTKTKATFYKAVHKRTDKYISDYDRDFLYKVGEKVAVKNFDNNPEIACSCGIHISNQNWALNYGKDWDDLAILELEVKIKDILLPKDSDGKVRVPEANVVREVPLEECGLYGKILAKRQTATAQ